ncbi:MAG: hypothetical protein IT165_30020 [Bryobacterales bacterium]|nr:hypothetical protein [Bryobacterales bacterium]
MLGSLFNKSRTRAEINRENAQSSTGPKTAAGKAASSRNALKEGFTASFAIVAPEDQEFYDQFLAGHRAELNPQGAQQEDLFRRITLAAWNIRRIEKLTLALYEETGADPLASEDSAITAKLERYTRHQTLNERSYYRGVKQLACLQKARAVVESDALPPQESAPPPLPDPEAEQTTSPTSQPASQSPEVADLPDNKTKPAEKSEILPQNGPANQAADDSDASQPDSGPNHLLLIIK